MQLSAETIILPFSSPIHHHYYSTGPLPFPDHHHLHHKDNEDNTTLPLAPPPPFNGTHPGCHDGNFSEGGRPPRADNGTCFAVIIFRVSWATTTVNYYYYTVTTYGRLLQRLLLPSSLCHDF